MTHLDSTHTHTHTHVSVVDVTEEQGKPNGKKDQ